MTQNPQTPDSTITLCNRKQITGSKRFALSGRQPILNLPAATVEMPRFQSPGNWIGNSKTWTLPDTLEHQGFAPLGSSFDILSEASGNDRFARYFLTQIIMSNLQPVSITTLSPADLEEMGFDANKVTEAEFDRLMRQMSDNYVENYFWHDLEAIADAMDLPRL